MLKFRINGTKRSSEHLTVNTSAEFSKKFLGEEANEEGSNKSKVVSLSLALQQTVPTIVVPDDDDPDYASVPVGEFGLAYLRGCGWKDSKSCIGKSNPQAVPLSITEPRPKGLGLGAALPSSAPSPTTARKRKVPENGDEEEETTALNKHSYIKCIAGLNKGSYGQVTSMDAENASVFVELAWPPASAGRTVRVSQWAVEVVKRKDYRERVKGVGDR